MYLINIPQEKTKEKKLFYVSQEKCKLKVILNELEANEKRMCGCG